MSGIAGTALTGKEAFVQKMLDKISHRGRAGREVAETENATLGLVCTEIQKRSLDRLTKEHIAEDEAESGHMAWAQVQNQRIVLMRDQLGVAPVYYGYDQHGNLCFASEVKALLEDCSGIKALPAGHRLIEARPEPYFRLEKKPPLAESPEKAAGELRKRLNASVEKRVMRGGEVGSWLSGGLDSSTMAALARPYIQKFHTFAAGLKGAPDLEHAQEVADFIKSEHHQVVVSFADLLEVLPDVIYHLESFDALLVRSSITNYLVAKEAAQYVNAVFSGEGGDELFAGYVYLKDLEKEKLADELIDIANRLQNTALQRVDRSASAHGTVAHVGFLDPEVVDYALRIPVEFKLREDVEKWILRRAMDGKLPPRILTRRKAKFWEGAGVMELISDYAEKNITDHDFSRERNLPNGWVINTKEELLYYRIFKEHFGELEDLSWMGRTKGAPKQ
ncbi:MAG: asparagine synthase-related protein [Candidatus Aminicenantes bacterium]